MQITPHISSLIDLALQEDIALGDITSEAIFSDSHQSVAIVESRQMLTVCGLRVAREVFRRVDHSLTVVDLVDEGFAAPAKEPLLRVTGSTVSILKAERTVLNFLQRMSGVATACRRFLDLARQHGVSARLVDTRKTLPGWRALDKYAVRVGGCHNHRYSLGEHVMIKDNHIAAAGGIEMAVADCRDRAPHSAKIEVEVKTLQELRAALSARADVIMLDNMTPATIREAVAFLSTRAAKRLCPVRPIIEVSGGVTADNLKNYAIPGVDVISIGALTHSAKAADISMEVLEKP